MVFQNGLLTGNDATSFGIEASRERLADAHAQGIVRIKVLRVSNDLNTTFL